MNGISPKQHSRKYEGIALPCGTPEYEEAARLVEEIEAMEKNTKTGATGGTQ